jgi:glycosyltransferase involved in cell wall biosynthesis
MRVLHVISSGGMYGAEAVILNLSREMKARGHRSVVGVFANEGKENVQLYEAARREGLEAELIPCSGQVDRGVGARLRALVKKVGAEVVHAHGYKADIYSYFGLKDGGVPLVSTCHSWYDNDVMVRLYGAADRRVLRRFAGVVAVSAEVRERLLGSGVRAERIRVIRNGIDLRPFAGAEATLRGEYPGLLVGLVGRLAREKGVDVFLRAAAVVLREMPEVRFVVVGDGPDKAVLEGLIEELGIGGKATLLGRREDMAGTYASLDVMVSASRQEGLPMAMLEGMASGRAMVATAVGEVPGLMVEGTGLLVQPEDVEGLAAAMLRLLRDEGDRKRLGAGARAWVEAEYSAGRMMEEYVRLYEGVAG